VQSETVQLRIEVRRPLRILTLRFGALLVSALVACLLPIASGQAADLTVGGTGASTELLRRLGDAFSKHGEAQVDVIPTGGAFAC
jgi:hypothetical protein